MKELLLSRTAKDSSKVFVGNVVSSTFAIVFTILAARALGPEGWGVVAAVGSFIAIVFSLGELGVGATMLSYVSQLWASKKSEALHVTNTVFSLRLLSASLLSVLVVLLSPIISNIIFRSDDLLLPIFAAIGVFGTLLLEFQVASTQAKQHFGRAAVYLALVNTFRLAMIFALIVFSDITLQSVLVVFTTSTVLSFFTTLLWDRPRPALQKNWQIAARKMAPFSGWMSVNRVVSTLNSRVDVLLLVQLSGVLAAGVYAAANRLAFGVPIVIGSFAAVLAPRYASIERTKLSAYFIKTVWMSLLLVIAIVVGIIISPFVTRVFGEGFEQSSTILRLLLVSFIPFALSTPAVNMLIYAFKQPRIIAALSLVQMPTIFALNSYLIPKLGAPAPAYVMILVHTSTLIVSYLYLFRIWRR